VPMERPAKNHYHNERLVAVVCLLMMVALFVLIFTGHWGEYHKYANEIPIPMGDVVYEGTNPPQELLNDPNYVWGRFKLEKDGQWIYFIGRKP
jgi:hypothetical protein